jgi:hypothetical protein
MNDSTSISVRRSLLPLVAAAFLMACSSSEDPASHAQAPPGDGEPGSSETGGSLPSGAPNDRDAGANADADAKGDGSTTPNDAKPLDLTSAAQKKWTYFAIEGTVCRDGSPAGIAINPVAGSKKLMVYLEGGGACFNAATCSKNPSKVSSKGASNGIFDRANAANPVGDWNFVFVPYCTGDVHVGANPNGTVPLVDGTQKFVGYTNTGRFLKTLAATFKGTTRVLLTGSSAGGFGAAGNYGQAVREFPGVPVNLVDDSGPLLRSPVLATCLQSQWRTLWSLDKTVVAECGADCQGQSDVLIQISKHWAKANSNFAQGLISSTADTVIRQMIGFGEANCTSYQSVSADAFATGVLDLRSQHAAYSNFGVYAVPGSTHTFVEKPTFYSTTAGSKSLAAWVGDIVDKDQVAGIGP